MDKIKSLPPDLEGLVTVIRKELDQLDKFTYWEIGRGLKDALSQLPETGGHRNLLLHEWSEEFDMDFDNLFFCIRFYELYPDLKYIENKIPSDVYSVLVTVPAGAERSRYEQMVLDQNLTAHEIRFIIQQERKQVISVERIEPYIYRTRQLHSGICVDLGFNAYQKLPNLPDSGYFRLDELGGIKTYTPVEKVSEPHYIYKASVLDVLVDDTVKLYFETGFDPQITREVRLRGIYSGPEKEHRKATQKYIKSRLKGCEFVAVRTYIHDFGQDYEAYMADIFYDKKETDYPSLVANGKFLNQELLDKGYAVVYE